MGTDGLNVNLAEESLALVRRVRRGHGWPLGCCRQAVRRLLLFATW